MAAFAKRNPKMQFQATCAICSRLGAPNAHTPCHPAVREGVERGTELITLEINMRLEAPTSHKSDRHINPVLHISLADRDRDGDGDGSCDVDVDIQSSNLQLCCVWERNTHTDTHTCTEWEWGEHGESALWERGGRLDYWHKWSMHGRHANAIKPQLAATLAEQK